MTIELKPRMFACGSPRLAVTKNWVTNNHWILHKSLIKNQLYTLSLNTLQDWLAVGLKRRDHIKTALTLPDEVIKRHLKLWRKGELQPIPTPLPDTYLTHSKRRKRHRIKLYPVGNANHMVTYTTYAKLFASLLTHILIVPTGEEKALSPAVLDNAENAMFCNEDRTFMLRPFRGADVNSFEKLKGKSHASLP